MSIWVDILNVVTAVAQVILSLSLTPDYRSVDLQHVFFRYTVPEKRNALYKLYSRAFAVHCAFSIYTILGVAGQVGDWVGYAAIVINIWMYASPLGTLKHVIATKNAASIPINLSVMIFVSASLWLASGIVDDDFFVWGINAIGTMLSFIQIVVYYIFRPTQQQDEMKDGDLTVVIDNATTTATVESPAYKPMPSPAMTMKK
ncbi:SWEET sugar transporter [Phytophthora cactorum]|nr:SWEET sugar transporter [Phytophthora cactorum]